MEFLTSEQRELFTTAGALDQYEVLKPIGKGKFAVVFKAIRKLDRQQVALKQIAIFDNTVMTARAREKTLKEVKLVQMVQHDNIIAFLDAFLDQNLLHIVFEWAEAGDLKRQIRKANEKQMRFDEQLIWKYFAQIAKAMLYLHQECRIMHRDLKPANIFLTLHGMVKLGDLGLGRVLSHDTLQAHSKVGTPLYMSPEVLRGDGYDWKSDVWSLGCILYELAMLRSPFKSEGLSLHGLFEKINKGDYEMVSNVYSETLRTLVKQMISLAPQDRPSMLQIWHTIQTLSLGHPSRALRPSSSSSSSSSINPPQTNAGDSTSEQRREPQQQSAQSTVLVVRRSRPKQKPLQPGNQEPWTSNNQDNCSRNSSPNQIQDEPDTRNSSSIDATPMLMETLYDKLQLLEYQVSRTKLSFLNFWLLQSLGVEFPVDSSSNESPSMISMRLLLVLENQVGFQDRINAASLIKGFGLEICCILNFLCDQVLRVQRPSRPVIRYDTEVVEEVPGASEDEEVVVIKLNNQEEHHPEEDHDDNDDDHDDDDDDALDPMQSEWLVHRPDDNNHETLEYEMIHCSVEPERWRLEVEQVALRLQEQVRKRQECCIASSPPWRNHLKVYRNQFVAIDSDWKPNETTAIEREENRLGPLGRALQTVKNEQSRLEQHETRLNHRLIRVCEARRVQQTRLAALTHHAQQLQQQVHESMTQLGNVQGQLQMTAAKVRQLCDQLSDPSALVQLNQRLHQLRRENQHMQLRLESLRNDWWWYGCPHDSPLLSRHPLELQPEAEDPSDICDMPSNQ